MAVYASLGQNARELERTGQTIFSIKLKANVISGNGGFGISISAAEDTVVAGNMIGLDSAGSHAIGNASLGVSVIDSSNRTRIGANGDGIADSLERNVISANLGGGIEISSSNETVIAGNLIGLASNGIDVLGNSGNGINLTLGATNTRIGTDGNGVADQEERNTISGHTFRNGIGPSGNGIVLSGLNTNETLIRGNYIGTDVNGVLGKGNRGRGIVVTDLNQFNNSPASIDVIENVISGNLAGVVLAATNVHEVRIQGNLIGLDKNGLYAIGNSGSGIIAQGTIGALIGTDGDGVNDENEGNVISGNPGTGIALQWPGFFSSQVTSNTRVFGNIIGLDKSGSVVVPNGVGMRIANSAGNVIGGRGVKRNIVSGNHVGGITIEGSPSIHNQLRSNLIGLDKLGETEFANGNYGIRLGIGATENTIGFCRRKRSRGRKRNRWERCRSPYRLSD